MIGVGYQESESATIEEGYRTRNIRMTNVLHPGEDSMNMNLDDPNDYRELNTRIKNYIMAEFVAVPPDFDLKSHLSMREQVGIFDIKDVDLKQVELISSSVTCSPVFCSLNNAILHPRSCFFFLQLLDELNLILKKIDNPVRRGRQEYKSFAEKWEQDRHNYVHGQEVFRISLIIINVVQFMNQEIIDEAWKAMESLQQYQKEVDSLNFKFD